MSRRIHPGMNLAFVICFLFTQASYAQETWGSGRVSGTGSSWKTDSVRSTSGGKNQSDGASWAAGKQNFGTARQQGGIWRDASAPIAATPGTGAKDFTGTPQLPSAFAMPVVSSAANSSGIFPVAPLQVHSGHGSHAPSGVHFGVSSGAHPGSSIGSSKASGRARGGSVFKGRGRGGTSLGPSLGSTTGLQTQPASSMLPQLPGSSGSGNSLGSLH